MRTRPKRIDKTATEAARWFARLSDTSISTDEVMRFRQWRADPANAAAYGQVERFWSESSKLSRDPAIQKILDGAGRPRPRRRSQRGRQIGGLAGGLAAIAIVATVGLIWVQPRLGGEAYETTVGQRRTVQLLDGSSVQLDTDSRIIVRYTATARNIQLVHGRALFNVAHIVDRPMSVRAGQALIRDLGTRFIVRDDQKQVSVVLLSGAVEVSKSDRPMAARALTPGQSITVAEVIQPPKLIDAAAATSWTSGELVFNDLPLGEAVAEMNRYEVHKIKLDGAGLESVHVSGTFEVGDASRFASALSGLYDLRSTTTPDGDISLSRSPSPP
jgi:transmembrane sensor